MVLTVTGRQCDPPGHTHLTYLSKLRPRSALATGGLDGMRPVSRSELSVEALVCCLTVSRDRYRRSAISRWWHVGDQLQDLVLAGRQVGPAGGDTADSPARRCPADRLEQIRAAQPGDEPGRPRRPDRARSDRISVGEQQTLVRAQIRVKARQKTAGSRSGSGVDQARELEPLRKLQRTVGVTSRKATLAHGWLPAAAESPNERSLVVEQQHTNTPRPGCSEIVRADTTADTDIRPLLNAVPHCKTTCLVSRYPRYGPDPLSRCLLVGITQGCRCALRAGTSTTRTTRRASERRSGPTDAERGVISATAFSSACASDVSFPVNRWWGPGR